MWQVKIATSAYNTLIIVGTTLNISNMFMILYKHFMGYVSFSHILKSSHKAVLSCAIDVKISEVSIS